MIYTERDIEILVATMDRNSFDFLDLMFPFVSYKNFNILIVNQTTTANILQSNNSNVRVINSFERGLSKSRNLALTKAIGKLLLIADDDVILKERFDCAIANAFNQNSDAALISFRTEKAPGLLFKNYPAKAKIVTSAMDWFNIMSVEMVLNKEKITAASLFFDERFGLGGKFGLGEEAVLLSRLHDKKLKVVMEPVVINFHPQNPSHTKISNKEKYYILGAVYTAMFGRKFMRWIVINLIFSVKQKLVTIAEVTSAFKCAIAGHRDFKKTL